MIGLSNTSWSISDLTRLLQSSWRIFWRLKAHHQFSTIQRCGLSNTSIVCAELSTITSTPSWWSLLNDELLCHHVLCFYIVWCFCQIYSLRVLSFERELWMDQKKWKSRKIKTWNRALSSHRHRMMSYKFVSSEWLIRILWESHLFTSLHSPTFPLFLLVWYDS